MTLPETTPSTGSQSACAATTNRLARNPDRWSELLRPTEQVVGRTRSGWFGTTLTPCGQEWDGIVMELPDGLAALDALGLPLDGGYWVLADYNRSELIVRVPRGDGERFKGVRGVRRVLGRGSYLLLPDSPPGVASAAWLSHGETPVQPVDLREALRAPGTA